MVKTYVKKPVKIEAIQFNGTNENEIFEWVGKHFIKTEKGLLIPTLEGDMLAETGDYIIRGVKGEYYPCKPDVFDMTYEEA